MASKIFSIVILVCLVSVKGFTSEISNFDIMDLKLGMTIDEVREKYPAMDIKIIKHWGTEDILYYTGEIPPSKFNNWKIQSLFFSSFKDGKKLFKLSIEQFVGENVLNEVRKKVVDKYGKPDCSNLKKNEQSIEMKWGNCRQRDMNMGNPSKGKYIRFLYDNSQAFLSMEDTSATDKIDHFIRTLDEKTRLKEVLEMDF